MKREQQNSAITGQRDTGIDGLFIVRSNVLRAMALPEGKHTVEFRFEPKSYYTGNKIAYAGSFILLAFVFGTFGFALKNKMKEWEAEPKPEVKKATAPAPKPGKKK